ncbi:hypothetical protein [Mucilaginibacter lappiensis]|uniref:Uncharacterized protein n=1 Tax=Mucilaginibacter lappiensis TaxID=354630 RepID=A0A841JPX6_9SPHI|nr:hypothetical protein [Mucilaginibacter lappiensis]MBB6131656.1 hypothetical protein [Mucilaginibacter lappiensis]
MAFSFGKLLDKRDLACNSIDLNQFFSILVFMYEKAFGGAVFVLLAII